MMFDGAAAGDVSHAAATAAAAAAAAADASGEGDAGAADHAAPTATGTTAEAPASQGGDHLSPVDVGATSDIPAPVQVRDADPAKTGGKKEVVFIDTSVADYQSIVASIKDGVGIELIDGGESGLAQIAQWAETHSGYDTIGIISHGSEGVLNLGTDVITASSLSNATVGDELTKIGTALTADGDLLLYGCDIGSGSAGTALLNGLAAATGADVAASDDATGAAAKNGDWILETVIGDIDRSAQLVSADGYDGVLSVVTIVVGDVGDGDGDGYQDTLGPFSKSIDGYNFDFTPSSSFDSIVGVTDVGTNGFSGLYSYDGNTVDGTFIEITPP